MPITDYNKKKKLDVDSVSGTPTVGKAQPILLVDGDDSTTGNGDIVIDFANISDAQDIAVYDQNGNLLDYEIENLDTTNETGVLWCYNSWVRDGTTQAQVAYGSNSANVDRQNMTGTWGNTGQNAEIVQHLSETSGNYIDSTSNNNDSTTETVSSRTAAGQFDGAPELDGTDDQIVIPADPSHTFGDEDFYISAWGKFTSESEMQPIFSQGQAGPSGANNHRLAAFLQDDSFGSRFQISVDDDSTLSVARNDPQNLDDGNWHHFVAVRDTGNNELRTYVDGSLSATGSDNTGSISNADGDALIGRFVGINEYANGNIDEVKIYRDVPTTAEIQAEYDASPKAGQVFFSQQAAETTAVSATVSDQLNLTETTGSTILFTASDTVAMTENNQQTLSDTLSESLGFNEATTSQLQDTLTDQLNLSEDTVGILIDTLTDQITFAENVNARLALTVTATDTLTFGERIDGKLFDTITEQLGLTENVNSALINAYADQLQLTENVQVAIAELLSDQLQFTEQTSSSVAATLADSLDFSENLGGQLIDILTDNLGFSEATAAAIAANLTDQLQFTENLEAFITLQLADQLDFSEETIGAFSKTFTDQLTFSDQVLFATLLEIDAPTKAIITNVNKFAVMENHVFKEGDQADEVSATLEDENGAIDLSNASSVDIVMQDRAGSTVLDTTATIQNAANGEVTYSWSSGDPIDTAGIYRLEWRINDGSGKQETVPNNGYITIEIEEELG